MIMPTTTFLEFDFSLTERELRGCKHFELRRVQLEPFFKEGFGTLLDQVTAKRAFLSHAVFIVLGRFLTVGTLPSDAIQQLTRYLGELADNSGYRPVHARAPEADLKSTPGVPADIYSTAYAARLFALCGEGLPNPPEVARWILSLQQPSGWFYDAVWADTQEDHKFRQELAMQMLQALFLLKLQSALPMQESAREAALRAVLALFQATWYMGTLADAVQALRLLGHRLANDQLVHIAEFLHAHFGPATGGFFEYQFKKAKFSTQTGAMQRYSHDYLIPSIPATFSALQLLLWLHQMGSPIDHTLVEGAARFFAGLKPGNGFGARVQIAKYAASLGPIASPYESLMALIAPALIDKIMSVP